MKWTVWAFIGILTLLTGCSAPQNDAAFHVGPPRGPKEYCPELWTVGGMGSYEQNPDDLYITQVLQGKIKGIQVDCSIPSATQETGPNSIYRHILDTKRWLDEDARQQARWALTQYINPKKEYGHFIRPNKKTHLKVLMVAPCTQTPMPEFHPDVEVDMITYRDPEDRVPNQEIKAPQDMGFFSQYGLLLPLRARPDNVPGSNRPGGIQGQHHFSGYWYPDLVILEEQKRQSIRKRGRNQRAVSVTVSEWNDTGRREDSIGRLKQYLNDHTVDYVLIGHSQGGNIIMQILHIGCTTGEESNEKK